MKTYVPPHTLAQRRALERQATAILRRVARRRRQARKPRPARETTPQELRRKLTLSDLAELRKKGLLP